jgi:hypothetical protein
MCLFLRHLKNIIYVFLGIASWFQVEIFDLKSNQIGCQKLGQRRAQLDTYDNTPLVSSADTIQR